MKTFKWCLLLIALSSYGLLSGVTVNSEDSGKNEKSKWRQCLPKTNPGQRWAHALSYDEARGRTVLFGGAADGGPLEQPTKFLNDTWEWDGKDWVDKALQTKPPARCGHALVYDSKRKKIILFGGCHNENGYYNDTWEYDGAGWTEKLTENKPMARCWQTLAYDSARERVVLFGGVGSQDNKTLIDSLDDTWEYDGENWKQLSPRTSPPGRRHHAMTYDLSRKVIVMFGGLRNPNLLQDTWEWDGKDWTLKKCEVKPPVREAGGLVYDSHRKKSILFGGVGPGLSLFNDTWEYDGSNWMQYSGQDRPSARDLMGLTYDSHRCKVVLFGGYALGASSPRLNDTWEYGIDK
ncbi:MAG: kelch repeat-containing protein [Planctomycetota bacterium]